MVRITITSGKLAGRSRELTLGDVDPMELFQSFLAHNDQWQTDYSNANEEEQFHFFRAELVAYIMQALANGLPVFFLDKKYQVEIGAREELVEVAGKLEDDISSSGRLVTIQRNDEQGLTIGVRGFEH